MSARDATALPALWDGVRRRQKDRTALHLAADSSRLSFGELHELESEWERALPKGLARGVVAVQLPNSADWFATVAALRRKGAIVMPIDPDMPADATTRILDAFRAVGLLGPEGFVPRDAPSARRRPDLGWVKLTSGSTGTPRGLFFTDSEMLADATNIRSSMGLRSEDCNLGLLPLGHSYALGNLVIPLLAFGMPICLGSGIFPSAVADDIRWAGCTVFPTVPPVLRGLAASTLCSLAPLRLVISAAATLDPDLARRFTERFGLRPHNFYGASETGGIAYDRSGHASLKGGSVGTALDGVQLETDRRRHLRVTSRAVSGYGRRETAEGTKAITLADRARLEEDGELVLLGRSDRLVKCAGRRVALDQLERRLAATRSGIQVAACFEPEREIIHIAHSGTGIDAERLREALSPAFKPILGRIRFTFIESFPQNARGKLDQRELKRRIGIARDRP